jgi:hypothetical protein
VRWSCTAPWTRRAPRSAPGRACGACSGPRSTGTSRMRRPLRGLLVALGAQNPPPDLAAWAAVEDPTSACTCPGRALRLLPPHRAHVDQPAARRGLGADPDGVARGLSAVSRGRAGDAHGGAAPQTLPPSDWSEPPWGTPSPSQTWRSLALEQGLEDEEAVQLMSGFVREQRTACLPEAALARSASSGSVKKGDAAPHRQDVSRR